MDKFDRMQQLHRIFKHRRTPISEQALANELECSTKTVHRHINNLRDYWHAPLQKIPQQGWRYNDPQDTYELPGLWLTSKELIGLASLLNLVREFDSSLIQQDIQPIEQQIAQLLANHHIDIHVLKDKIKILPTTKQHTHNHIFDVVNLALIQNQRLQIDYQDYEGRASQRDISPQQLVYYQENWYLDSYCHLRAELRSFKLANIQQAHLLKQTCIQVEPVTLQQHYASSYGIFSGEPKHTAQLEFYGNAAREAASRQWHPQQQGIWQGANYELRFPYNDDRELIRDILKYADQVKVLAPTTLQHNISQLAEQVRALYD